MSVEFRARRADRSRKLRFLFLISFESFVVFVVPAGVVEIGLSEGRVANDALRAFFLGVFGCACRERQEKKAYASDDGKRSKYLVHLLSLRRLVVA